jgi:hypothetical protein
VSALCSTRRARLVSGDLPIRALPTVTARLTPSEKKLFAALAASHGISESALALIAIRGLLSSNRPVATAAPVVPEAAPDRITIRLRPGGGNAIADRAAKRGIKSSKYLAALVRAHVGLNPPLTNDELLALKKAVAVLARLGLLLARLSRSVADSSPVPNELLHFLTQIRSVVAEVEHRVHDLARAALISWETRYDQNTHQTSARR